MKTSTSERRPKNRRRVFLLDDHPMTRRGLAGLINGEPDLMVSGEAADTEHALAMLAPPLPELVLADITMPGKSGLEFIRELNSAHPEVPVLVLSMHDEAIHAERVLRAGARGYIMKVEGGEKLLEAIRQVLQGRTFLSDKMSAVLMQAVVHGRPAAANAGLAVLTDREFEVFQLIGKGFSSRQISQRLSLSIPTVGTHRMHIKEKLKLKTGAELTQHAAVWAAAQNLV